MVRMACCQIARASSKPASPRHAISSSTLAETSMKLGQAMYEASQKEAAEADAKADAAKDSDVVDADFEEIDEDDDKKKSA